MANLFTTVITKRDDNTPVTHTTIGLLIALIVLIILGGAAIGTLLVLRRRRNAQRDMGGLPFYNEKRSSTGSSSSPRSRHTRESIIVYQEKKNLLQNSDSPPSSPLPEIRITFPEEFDAAGKRTSGRVVVVKVGDTSIGLEPLDEKLPAYEQEDGPRFHSIDLDRVGGLREKEHDKMWS